eukprot:CAMPEP_0174717662 /NCGR_PEP_ID=MMETSP1094-20130205/26868_1 /TAXON_ID=156173 /ORGANISM="Chrysochromulina brevifilum, Strain UTEX LB 985" /LENGTH=258 /DNA_ID=CAMNT_0015917629 /DNA_START=377 /DNA_END=1150 /DNA_ORIENTATION=-
MGQSGSQLGPYDTSTALPDVECSEPATDISGVHEWWQVPLGGAALGGGTLELRWKTSSRDDGSARGPRGGVFARSATVLVRLRVDGRSRAWHMFAYGGSIPFADQSWQAKCLTIPSQVCGLRADALILGYQVGGGGAQTLHLQKAVVHTTLATEVPEAVKEKEAAWQNAVQEAKCAVQEAKWSTDAPPSYTYSCPSIDAYQTAPSTTLAETPQAVTSSQAVHPITVEAVPVAVAAQAVTSEPLTTVPVVEATEGGMEA